MSTNFQQVIVTVQKHNANTIEDVLTDSGAMSVTVESANEQELFDAAAPSEPGWERQKLTALYEPGFCHSTLLQELSSRSDVDSVATEQMEDREWERSWLDQFAPVQVGHKLWVCPSWLTPPDRDAVNLIIDPGLAFGTGTHATTHLCLEYLSQLNLEGKLIVDYGCGSGILSIAALALGAERAIGIDVDERALAAAESNAVINGVADRFITCSPEQVADLAVYGSADVLIANILAGTLLELHEELVRIASKFCLLMLSGILQEQGDQVMARFSSDFSMDIRQREDWLLLFGQRVHRQL